VLNVKLDVGIDLVSRDLKSSGGGCFLYILESTGVRGRGRGNESKWGMGS